MSFIICKFLKHAALTLAGTLLTFACFAQSHLISDVIRSNGTGDITLADETALGDTVAERMQRLEALRPHPLVQNSPLSMELVCQSFP